MSADPREEAQNLLLFRWRARAPSPALCHQAGQAVPFRVLDEIDATLDESNLHRFNQLMQEFAQDTQFLVVTHRQTTMESAHTLYGVTMGAEGGSKIIAVALKQEE